MSLPAISNTSPALSMKLMPSTISTISLPIAPAFIRNPPPMLPGIPSRNSIPARQLRLASAATFFIRAPAPQRMRSPSVSMATNGSPQSRTVSPRTPLSSTRKLEPSPSTVTGKLCSRQTRTSAASPSIVFGSAYQSAAPPARSVVFSPSGASFSTSVPSSAADSNSDFRSG